jgi:hypothetical protein
VLDTGLDAGPKALIADAKRLLAHPPAASISNFDPYLRRRAVPSVGSLNWRAVLSYNGKDLQNLLMWELRAGSS